MSSIPEELYHEILLRVPAKSIFACKCVCKTWYELISKPDFVKSHLNLITTSKSNNPSIMYLCYLGELIHSVIYDSLILSSTSQNELCDIAVEMSRPFNFEYCLGLLASCDGLVLLYLNASGDFEHEGFLCLWNPATREYKQMPRSPNQDYEKDIGIYGFGYDYNIDDYKVFKIVDVSGETIVEVYTLGLDSWKSIRTIPYRFDANRTPGVIVNGSLHWLGKTGDEDIFNTIVSLDISNDRFEEVKLPKETLEDGHLFGNVELLEGCLCVFSYIDKVRYEVWVMRDYGVQEFWTKRYVISHERIMDGSFLSIMWTFIKNDEILLQGRNGFVLYDLGHFKC